MRRVLAGLSTSTTYRESRSIPSRPASSDAKGAALCGTSTGTPCSFQGLDTRTGFTAGGGVDWAFSGPWSVNVEYDYYQFGHGNVFMTDSVNGLTGLVDTKQSIQVVKVGLNFHMWSSDQ